MSAQTALRDEIVDLAGDLVAQATKAGIMVATAESCTGGMIGAAITDVAGSSAVFDRGFITYSNAAKIDMLGVSPDTLAAFGAVSAQTAAEMASGARHNSRADIAVSVTGIAGPGGGSRDKPVGLVWMGLCGSDGGIKTVELRFPETASRDTIRLLTVKAALSAVLLSMAVD